MKLILTLFLSIGLLWAQKDQVMVISVYHNMPYPSDTTYYEVYFEDWFNDNIIDTIVREIRPSDYKNITQSPPIWAEFSPNDYSYATFGFIDSKISDYIIRLKFLTLRKE